jgi:hypothetical protein
MCKWGTNTEMEIAGRTVKVDYCLATLLALLNSAGMPTVASPPPRPARGSLRADQDTPARMPA